MQRTLARASGLARSLSATAKTVPSKFELVGKEASVVLPQETFITENTPIKTHSSTALAAQLLPRNGFLFPRVTSGPCVPSQIRLAHTDVRVPDEIAHYRRDPSNTDAVENAKLYTYLAVAAGTVPVLYGGKYIAQAFISSMAASADVMALATLEVNLTEIAEGENVTFMWRGKPLFVRHRTAEEAEIESKVDISSLRDPETDAQRAQRPEWLIVIGICTHLGCVPLTHQGDFGGYFCPCHGSHYDASGRIRIGPAPSNLEVPEYDFVSDEKVIVGVEN